MSRPCRVPGCTKPAGVPGTARGLCSMHYSRVIRYGDPHQERAKPRQRDLPCTVAGCDRPRAGNGLCQKHWMQAKRRGDPCAPRLKGDPWTPEEDRKLLDLPTYPRSGMVRMGELDALSLHLGRSVTACASRLYFLRGRRR